MKVKLMRDNLISILQSDQKTTNKFVFIWVITLMVVVVNWVDFNTSVPSKCCPVGSLSIVSSMVKSNLPDSWHNAKLCTRKVNFLLNILSIIPLCLKNAFLYLLNNPNIYRIDKVCGLNATLFAGLNPIPLQWNLLSFPSIGKCLSYLHTFGRRGRAKSPEAA